MLKLFIKLITGQWRLEMKVKRLINKNKKERIKMLVDLLIKEIDEAYKNGENGVKHAEIWWDYDNIPHHNVSFDDGYHKNIDIKWSYKHIKNQNYDKRS